METTAELILKGHFSKLREQINKEVIRDADNEGRLEEMLNQVFKYLRRQQIDGILDAEGLELYHQLSELLNEVKDANQMDVPGKLPMQKAGGRSKTGGRQKTGT
ncbi:hypothetical protein C900_00074 [Fulvivirga imtechensis AK7]|uniref:Uncharacterized protein n=1 Tax=Fulvivirga imtechensis AK7 TaxID=1237149 RepID=L8JYN5_9BACT|nr:hypothetical protein [Fulvivirga imtechensis]ELR73910.1 hypothetical protein C900_00074 [Fulvivirga imtechensis AK7]